MGGRIIGEVQEDATRTSAPKPVKMELSIVDGDSPNLLRFNLPVLSRDDRVVSTAYTLMDGGASHKFVKPSLLEAIEAAAGEKMERRHRGTMELTSAGKVEYLPRVQVKLKIVFGRFKYSGWFTLYNLVKYDIILGKDWMEEIKHDIDHTTNVLTVHRVGGIGPVRLRGLVRGVGREGGISEEDKEGGVGREQGMPEEDKERNNKSDSGIDLMVVEQVVAYIDPPGERECEDMAIPTTACREYYSSRRTEPVSARTRRMASLEAAKTIHELFAAELNQMESRSPMDTKIRKEYADLFKEPDGLPPHRPKFGDFCIQLIP
jgi:hypothetical protein